MTPATDESLEDYPEHELEEICARAADGHGAEAFVVAA